MFLTADLKRDTFWICDILPVSQYYAKLRYIENTWKITKVQICEYITTFSRIQKYWFGWVARGNLTPTPSQIGTWQSPVIPLLPAFLLWPRGLKPTQKEPGSSPALAGLTFACCELTHPLRSSPITGPSTLLLDDPPLCFASVLSFSWGLHLNFSLNIETTGSHVPHKSPDQVHAISMPDAAQTINRLPLSLSWGSPSTPVLTPSQIFRHLINGSLTLISLIHTWHGLCHAFSLTLTTTALYRCSLRGFEACSCKPTPRGLPSSSVQLRTLYIKSALVAHLEISLLFYGVFKTLYIVVLQR
jgi:hypothetical protein